MALFHSHALPHRTLATLSPFSTFYSKPLCFSLPHPSSSSSSSSSSTHQHRYPLSSTIDLNNKPLSLSTLPRKLLCKPPQGKHVREDYLVKKLSAQEIQELVKGERNVPLIIDFYATWCGPCVLMAQELEMLAVEYENNAMIVKVDTDDEYEFARDMQVRGLPTLFFIRLKRDEWSEGAVSTLLEAYEAKWVLRNRAKLKGQDWEDVAKYVSSRANSTKSPKTQTQCKNKIESMKKRYRSESATSDASAWPLYSRLDLLLRGTGPISTTLPLQTAVAAPSQSPQHPSNNKALMLLEPSLAVSQAPHQPPLTSTVAPPPPTTTAQNSHGSNGVDKLAKEDGLETKSSDHVSIKNPLDTDSSTPALYSDKDNLRCNKRKMRTENNNNKRRKKEDNMGIAESIRWLAEVVVRSEQTRMDTLKEIERMRVEAEAKRGEMEIKRTEIIANTQLEIARIFANVNKGVDSSLRIGRS